MSSAPSTASTASTVSNLFGRKYRLDIRAPGTDDTIEVLTVTDSAFEPEALRIVFDVYTPCIHEAYWYANIDIYNLDATTSAKLIASSSNLVQGMNCVLQAGYASGNYDTIWQGPIFQVLFDRENVVDYKITLNCILSLESVLSGNVINTSYAGFDQTEIILNMVKAMGLKQDFISPGINQKKLSRGKVLFGTADKYLTQIAEDNNMVWFLSQRGLSIGALNDGQSTEAQAIVYTPATGLIGTPCQTQQGVDFTVLLDPRIKAKFPLAQVSIDNVLVQQYKRQIGEQILPLDQNGVYTVGSVRHQGDSRGTPWYTHITGYSHPLAWLPEANVNR